jgi:tRNA modification GTPase
MATGSSNGLSSALAGGADTVVAVATGGGRAALALIRLSGPESHRVAAEVCPAMGRAGERVATVTAVRGNGGDTLDHGVGVLFSGPRSYTGEDMLELTVHGSPYLVGRVVASFTAAGARPAAPGEFTRRAVANGKMDILQAEAVHDLVTAETAQQLRNARRQLAGELSGPCRELRAAIIAARAEVEAGLDYEAQGVSVTDSARDQAVGDCLGHLDRLLLTAVAGDRLRNGMRVAICGPPNSGKSTFFNYLCGLERAIVAAEPGTTRDVIEAQLEIEGRPVTVADTAGLRASGDEVEVEGQRRAMAVAADADLVLWLESVDTATGEAPWARLGRADHDLIRVRSKVDLEPGAAADEGWLRLSCHTGEGVAELMDRVRATVAGDGESNGDDVMISARHQTLLQRARREVAACRGAPPELAAEHLRWAQQAVAEVVGEVSSDDVLDEIFRVFCIGK